MTICLALLGYIVQGVAIWSVMYMKWPKWLCERAEQLSYNSTTPSQTYHSSNSCVLVVLVFANQVT